MLTVFLLVLLLLPVVLLVGAFMAAGLNPPEPPAPQSLRSRVLTAVGITYCVLLWLAVAAANCANWVGNFPLTYVALLAASTMFVGGAAWLVFASWLDESKRLASVGLLAVSLILSTPMLACATVGQFIGNETLCTTGWLLAVCLVGLSVVARLAIAFGTDFRESFTRISGTTVGSRTSVPPNAG